MNSRRGSILIDAVVATALLAALTAVSLQAMTTIAAGRRATQTRAIAVQLAAGALERASALPWDDLTGDKLAQLAESHPVDASLSGAQLTLTVEDAKGDLAQRQLCAEIAWPKQSPPAKPVKLYSWVYPARSVQP